MGADRRWIQQQQDSSGREDLSQDRKRHGNQSCVAVNSGAENDMAGSSWREKIKASQHVSFSGKAASGRQWHVIGGEERAAAGENGMVCGEKLSCWRQTASDVAGMVSQQQRRHQRRGGGVAGDSGEKAIGVAAASSSSCGGGISASTLLPLSSPLKIGRRRRPFR